MSRNAASVEQLLQQARGGDKATLKELLERCRDGLSNSAQQHLSGTDAETIPQVVEQTLNDAAQEFGSCASTSEQQFGSWLEEILARRLVPNDSPTPNGFHGSDETLPGTGKLPDNFGGMETMVGNAPPTKSGEAQKPENDSSDSNLPDGFGSMDTMVVSGSGAAEGPPAADANATANLPDGFDSMDTMVGSGPAATTAPTSRPGRRRASSDQTVVGGTAPTPSFNAATARRFGKYELLSVIAKGGMGVVHKARDTRLNRIVALKMILSGQFADDVEIDRFYTEAESAARLRHPNIVAIHEVGEAEGQHFFAMDFIDGQSLSDLIRENPLPPRRAAEMVKKIADAMAYAHAEGILHRDLKPSNVLLDQSLEPMITDFGLAKQIEGQSQLTMSGAIVGTPSYMPPEQASGKLDEVSVRSDVYSLGAVLYELATGRPLFRAANPFETIKQVLNNEPIPLRMLNPGVPVDLETICLKCLQKEPARRYATSQELSDELSRFLAREPILARPVGPTERFWRWCRRNPKIAAMSATVIVSLLLTVVVLFVSNIRTSAALAEADESFRQAREAVDELFTKVSEDVLFNQPGMQHVRKDLLKQAMKYYERFLGQRGNDPRVQDELGEALYRMGQITEIIDSPAEALTLYNRARTMQERLLDSSPSVTRLDNLGDTWTAIGRASVRTGDHDAGLEAYAEAVSVRQKLVDQQRLHQERIEFLRKLASSEMNIGLVRSELGTIAEANNDFESADGQFDLAFAHFQSAQKIRGETLADAPNELKLRRDLGKGYYNLANLSLKMQDDESAERHIDTAMQTFEKLVEDEPADLENKYLHANCFRRAADFRGIFGDLYYGDYVSGQDVLDEYFEKLPELALGTGVASERAFTGLGQVNLGIALVETATDKQLDWAEDEWRAALKLEETALEKMEELARNNPIVIFYKGDQAGILLNMGQLLSNLEEEKQALDCFKRARDILAPLVAQYPVPRYEADLNTAEEVIQDLTAPAEVNE